MMSDKNFPVETSPYATLPLPLLRLMTSPLRLLSGAVWKMVQRKLVSHYGMLEELVSLVTDLVPELLSSQQKVQLSLGLRAKLILEMCHCGVADLHDIQPHLDRMQSLTNTWTAEVGGRDADLPCSNFVDVVKRLLRSPVEKEYFFQSVFPEDFGPAFDEALHALMWLFLSRLEKFVPLQTFQQVACALGEAPSVLEECVWRSVSQCEELRTLLQYQRNLAPLDHHDPIPDGACIISALKRPPVRPSPQTQGQHLFLEAFQSCVSQLDKESSSVPHTALITTDTVSEQLIRDNRADACSSEPGEELHLENLKMNQNTDKVQCEDVLQCVSKECKVQLTRIDGPRSQRSRSVRPNRGLKMKSLLLEEKKTLEEDWGQISETSEGYKEEDTDEEEGKGEERRHSDDVALISPYSEDSFSFCSDQNADNKSFSGRSSTNDSWCYYSDNNSSLMSPPQMCPSEDSLKGRNTMSTTSRNSKLPNNEASSSKNTHKLPCFICKEALNTKLETHLKIHFPTGDYACPRCDARFNSYRGLQQHLKLACYDFYTQQISQDTPDKPGDIYKCEKCTHAFQYKMSLQRHMVTHHELYCNVCQKVLRDAETLARHKVSHTPFQCNRCSQSFTLFKHLVQHCQNVHKVKKRLQCYSCSLTVVSVRRLIIHEWTHTGHLPFQCAQCGWRVRDDSDLINHLRVHTREKPYLCPECGKTFSHRSSMMNHLNFIHGESQNEKKHACPQCEKSFKQKGALQKHQRIKHLKEMFHKPCPHCGKMISSSMARHIMTHTGERPFKCSMCDDSFRSKGELNNHVLRRHTSEKPFICDVCGKGFAQLFLMKHHAKIHSGEKSYARNICGKSLSCRSSMLKHLNLIHGESRNEKKHTCSQCEKSFKQKGALKRHQRIKHLKEVMLRKPCPHCGKMMSSSSMARHILTHTGERPFKCSMCDESFRSKGELNNHVIRRHTSERPFICDVCGKGFAQLSWMKHHAKIHSGEKPHVCTICGKRFSFRSSMVNHLKLIHGESRNEKKHACSQCEKSFKWKGALTKHYRIKHLKEVSLYKPCLYCGKLISSYSMARHILIHTGERPFKCSMCDKSFRSNPAVDKHMLMWHTSERSYKCDICGMGFIKMWHLNKHAKIHSGEKP